MTAAIAFLQSERFVFAALLCVLLGQVANFAHIFSAANPHLTAGAPAVAVWLYAGICTVGLEMAILVSVLNGKRTVAALFAAGFLAINLCWNYQVWADPLPVAVAKSLIYVMLSVTIWFFSDLFGRKISSAGHSATANPAPPLPDAIPSLPDAIPSVRQMRKPPPAPRGEPIKTPPSGVRGLPCPGCGRMFGSQSGVNAHKQFCKAAKAA